MQPPAVAVEGSARQRDHSHDERVEPDERIEKEVHKKSKRPKEERGSDLMRAAFNPDNGPLTDMQEAKSSRAALMMLFVGAFGRFTNPESHENREFADPLEPMQELMFASRLLTIAEGRSRSSGRTEGK